MKKHIFLIILLCLAVILCSCNKEYKDHETSTTVNSSQDENHISIVMPGCVEKPLLTIVSIEDYNKLINTQKIPTTFVRLESIEQLGEFVSLVFLSDAYAGDFSSYMYTLVDTVGYEVALYINSDESSSLTTSSDSITSVNTSDMRYIAEQKSGIYVTERLVYRYVSGKLLSISWVADGINYTLCGDPLFYDYPITASTFLSKLMTKSYADEAIKTAFDAEIQ